MHIESLNWFIPVSISFVSYFYFSKKNTFSSPFFYFLPLRPSPASAISQKPSLKSEAQREFSPSLTPFEIVI